MSRIENLNITPDAVAKVVVDERTGAIVMGQNVRISPIAISHGNLNIQIKAPPEPQDQQATQTPDAQTALALADNPSIVLFKGEVDLKEVVDGLNKIGATSTDLVQVLKIIKTSGALHADLEIR
jgi:flagellar P-ring protein precursor FlgI